MALDAYWQQAQAHRMSFADEVTRLVTVLHGFWARYPVAQDILAFYSSERPYGSKDIPASIAFNLGWDWQRKLRTDPLPSELVQDAWELHNAVYEKLTNPQTKFPS